MSSHVFLCFGFSCFGYGFGFSGSFYTLNGKIYFSSGYYFISVNIKSKLLIILFSIKIHWINQLPFKRQDMKQFLYPPFF